MSGDVIADFLAAMRERGLEPDEEIIADGELHRVRWIGDKSGTRNGAYVLHLNARPAGFVECFKRGIRFTWSAKGGRLSSADRRALRAQMAKERKRRQGEERERHELVAKRAQAIPEACRDAGPEHAYLKCKGIGPHGLKADAAGRLVVPLRDPKSTIWSLQTITPDGKRFLKGGRKSGRFHLLGEPGNARGRLSPSNWQPGAAWSGVLDVGEDRARRAMTAGAIGLNPFQMGSQPAAGGDALHDDASEIEP